MFRHAAKSESGYILLTVLFMVVLLLIALAVAAPRIATSIQRDREEELIHRGKQYTRAIKLYYKKFGRYPSSIDQLEKTNNIRFLRKRYVDPMTGKDDWKLIYFGQAHVKAMGLFGQPIQNGGMSTTAGSSMLGGTPGMTSNPMGGTANPLGGTMPSSGIASPASNTGSDSSGNSNTPGATNTGPTSPFSTGTSSFGSSGQTLGGGPIVGVASKSTKASIKEYKQQKHYNEWEFVYDPVEDLMSSASLLGGGQGASGNLNGPGSNGTTTPGSPSNSSTPVPTANPSAPPSNPPMSPQ